jgi:hypothetical protein
MFRLLDRLAARLLRSDSDDLGCLLGLCLLPGWPFGALLTFLRASFRPPAGRWDPHGSAGKCFVAYSLLCGVAVVGFALAGGVCLAVLWATGSLRR